MDHTHHAATPPEAAEAHHDHHAGHGDHSAHDPAIFRR